MNKLIFYILICFLITSSCKKKFEEGPLISFRSAEKRLQGTWKYTSFKLNGIEKIDSIKTDSFIHIVFFTKGSKTVILEYSPDNFLGSPNIPANTSAGNYQLEKNILTINHHFDKNNIYTIYTPPFSLNKDTITQWTIVRLKNKELKLLGKINNREHLLEFVALTKE